MTCDGYRVFHNVLMPNDAMRALNMFLLNINAINPPNNVEVCAPASAKNNIPHGPHPGARVILAVAGSYVNLFSSHIRNKKGVMIRGHVSNALLYIICNLCMVPKSFSVCPWHSFLCRDTKHNDTQNYEANKVGKSMGGSL